MERKRSLILVEIEVTRNTDPTPAVNANEIVTYDEVTIELLTKENPRPVPLAYFGELAPSLINEGIKLGFKTELKGSGAAGTAPRIDPILRAANLTKTTNSGTSVVYAPNSVLEGESCAVYFYHAGSLHKLTGGVANIKSAFVVNDNIMLDIEVTGTYAGTTDVSFPTPTFDSISPIVYNNANFKLNTVTTLINTKIDFDLGNEIAKRADANSSNGVLHYFVKNRKPKVSMDVEKVALTTLDPWTLAAAKTLIDLEAKPTGTAGNIIELVVNDIALDTPKYGNKEDIVTWELSGAPKVTLSAGNGEFSLTFK